jgi:XTP/dITP diphosphohydrolase
VIAYLDGKRTLYFEGIVRGRIATEMSGEGGFGYDPIFIPEGYDETFAALSAEVKKNISHRARAVKALIEWLSNP